MDVGVWCHLCNVKVVEAESVFEEQKASLRSRKRRRGAESVVQEQKRRRGVEAFSRDDEKQRMP
jgi:hypothetical protein